MLDINENITLNGSVKIEGVQAVNMTANIYTESNMYPVANITIIDKELYKSKYDICKKGINEFVDAVLKKQYEVLGESEVESK